MKHQHSNQVLGDSPRSIAYECGKYGRLFPWLSPQAIDSDEMRGKMNTLAGKIAIEEFGINSQKPAGYTYLGQFIAHDLTFDPTSIKERQVDPEQLHNFRTPALDLDAIYGGGPMVNPYFYERNPNGFPTRFLLIENPGAQEGNEAHKKFYDVPRLLNSVAIIADPRNDENLFVSQMHVAFLFLHNYFEQNVPASIQGEARFLEAQKLLRWHYQYVVLHDYLNVVLDPVIVQSIMPQKGVNNGMPNLRFFDWRNEPFMPLEFSGAVFRFGHSQVRAEYRMHGNDKRVGLFQKPEGIPPQTYVNWNDFFGEHFNNFFTIDHKLTKVLSSVPGLPGMPPINLAYQNLVRGLLLRLPSGQAIARALGEDIQIPPRTRLIKDGIEEAFIDNTPLWLYILLEAQTAGKNGRHLGPVGSRIVAEVIIGLVQGDKTSYLNHDPNWKPDKGKNDPNATFKMADLLQLAGIYNGALVPLPQQS